MKLTQKALTLISVPTTRMKIGIALGVTDQTMRRYIKDNDETLTLAAAMKVIRQETGLDDTQILLENASTTA